MPIKAGMDKPQVRDLTMDVRAFDEEARTVELSISSEEPYDRWFGTEILGHSDGEVDYSRLNDIGVLFWNHNTNMPVGPIEKAWLDPADRKLRIRAKFDTDPQSDLIFQKVKSKTLRGASIGYVVKVWEEVEANAKSTCGRFTGPCYIARRWTALEGSIVGVPADPTVGVGRSIEELPGVNAPESTEREEGGVTVTEEEKKALEQKAAEDAKRAAEAAEAKVGVRVREISALCETFGLKTSEYLEKTVEEVKDAILKMKAEESHKTAVPTARPEVVADESDKFRAAGVDAILMRGGLKVEKPAPGADELRGATIVDLARECLERNAVKAPKYDKHELIRSAMGVSDFTYLLSGGINKSLLSGYEMAPATYQAWCKKGTLPDFKGARRILVSEFGDLPEVKPQGEYTRAKISDGGEEISLYTVGHIFAISRQAMINDDLDALVTIPQKQGYAFRMTVNTAAYDELVSGTVGGATIYSSGNGNLTDSGSGGAPSVTQIAKGLALMSKQKCIGSKQTLGVRPAFLIVPVALEVTAIQLIGSVYDPAIAVQTPNPFNNRLTVVGDPVLDAAPAAWYLAAAPGVYPTIEVAFLDGNDRPRLEQQTGWERDGTEFKVSGDFGVKVLDFRGLYKNVGA